jgi:hypothetical protein
MVKTALVTGSRIKCPNCRGGYINPEGEDRAECPACECWQWLALPLTPDALEALGVSYAWERDLVADEYAHSALGVAA